MLGQWSYVLFAIGLFNAILGLLVLLRDRRRPEYVAFAALCSAIGLWVIGIAGFGATENLQIARIFAKVFYIAPLFVGLFFVYFSLLFPGGKKIEWHIVFATGLPVFALAIPLVSQPQFITQTIHIAYNANSVSVNQGHYFAYALVVVGLFGYALLGLFRKVRRLRGIARTQLRLFFTMGLFVSAIGIWFNIVLAHWLGDYRYVWVGPLATAAYIIANAFNMVRHRMFDIRAATARSLAYVLSLAALGGLYYLLAYITSFVLFSDTVSAAMSVSPINVALALFLAFIFQPLKRFFDHLTSRVFYRDTYSTDVLYTEIGRIVTGTARLHELLDEVLKTVVNTLNASSGLFIVYRDHHDDVLAGEREYKELNEREYDMLKRYGAFNDSRTLVVDASAKDTETAQLYKMLSKKNIALVLPLVSSGEIIGYLLLGEQLGAGYSRRDIRVLNTIANELVIAILNARSVQVVRDLNTHLEERVTDATRQLVKSNKRLLELDETKDEFLSMASHQLRTPLTSVKGYISMVLEGDVGDVTPAQRQLLEEAYTSSERMVHLIGDFLNVSRLQTGKFVIDTKQCDLANIVRQEVDGMRQIAVTHDIELKYGLPARFPSLYIDEGKIRQVVMNFIDNAIYYSPEGKEIKITLRVEEGDVVLRVADKGMGVPAEAQKKLFSKFYRADNAKRQRPDGTGIGLYLAKKIIDGHGGTLVFESQEGKGSTFGFRLPIKKLSVPPTPQVVEE